MSRPASLRFRRLLVATILTVATGCDKANAGLQMARQDDEAPEPPPSAQLDLSRRPDVLFQIFGSRDDPRMIPLAAISAAGSLTQIVLSSDKWRVFDTLYTGAGDSLRVYRDGRPAGAALVRQGMWAKGSPLYTLPGCRRLTPLAAVSVPSAPETDYTVEYLASTAQLGTSHAEVGAIQRADAARLARKVGEAVAKERGIGQGALAELDFRALAVPTGASREPTLVASFMPPPALHANASGDGGSRATHVFALADARSDGYAVTFRHTVASGGAEGDFRRYVDHLDIDRDGIDEIVLESWRASGDTFLVVLAFRNGAWTEIFRSRDSWCLDERAK